MSKFEVGEVCFALIENAAAIREVGASIVEVTLLSYDKTDQSWETDIVCNHTTWRHWWAREGNLRKKRPPQQDTEIAEEDFIKELNAMIFRDEVKV